MSQDPRDLTEQMSRALLSSAYLVLLPSGGIFRTIAPGPLAYENALKIATQVRGYLVGMPVIEDCTRGPDGTE